MPDSRPHLFIASSPLTERYSPHVRGSSAIRVPVRDRGKHGELIRGEYSAAIAAADTRRTASAVGLSVEPADGIYLQFESEPGFDLALDRLELAKQGIELRTATRRDNVISGMVFIPDGKLKIFLDRLQLYLSSESKKGNPRYQQLVESIGAIRLATLELFWTDDRTDFPKDPSNAVWWEIWLRDSPNDEHQRLRDFAGRVGIEIRGTPLRFLDRYVVLARASSLQLSSSPDILNDLAELRLARTTPTSFLELPSTQQTLVAQDLANRLTLAPQNAPAVCLFDTGVNREHPLLKDSLATSDLHSCSSSWGVHDHHGHGTEMAGLALLGDLATLAAGAETVNLTHRLESVKLLPPDEQPGTPPDLWGSLTAQACARAETQEPTRRRCLSMAITAFDDQGRGTPSSWSAEIDMLSSGMNEEEPRPKRLFVLSAGNKDLPKSKNYFDECLVSGVHDPGQSWNALTVGAFTEFFEIDDADYTGWEALAPRGDLSPTSSTSVVWQPRWPIKPDVVMEGGNVGFSPSGQSDYIASLSLLTTYYKPLVRQFTATGETSAAATQVARLAAMIQARYPDLWPETVRGIIIDSANWNDAMLKRLPQDGSLRPKEHLVRCYGFGVPNFQRALNSAGNAATLVVQQAVQPYEKDRMKDMHIHALPWPRDVFSELGDIEVKLKVTLSYFVEPNPARRGWRRPNRYASHGLRFDVKAAYETLPDFRKRLNKMALAEEEEKPVSNNAAEWRLGPRLRNKGSIHSDVWHGSAADLAERGYVGIYPVVGWWRERASLNRWKESVRYSLIISISTPRTDIDIYEPIAALIKTPINIGV
jgi:hypothetical protein